MTTQIGRMKLVRVLQLLNAAGERDLAATLAKHAAARAQGAPLDEIAALWLKNRE